MSDPAKANLFNAVPYVRNVTCPACHAPQNGGAYHVDPMDWSTRTRNRYHRCVKCRALFRSLEENATVAMP